MKTYQKLIVYSALVAGSLGLLNGYKKVYEGSEGSVDKNKVAILSNANVDNKGNLEQILGPYNEITKYQSSEGIVGINQTNRKTLAQNSNFPTNAQPTVTDEIFYKIMGGIILGGGALFVLSSFVLVNLIVYNEYFN